MATHTQLTALPAELLVKLYQALPSFNDAFNLKATCHAPHDIWANHRSIIVNNIVSTHFECNSSARQLLAKQRNGVPLDKTEPSDHDLSRLIQNTKRIKEAIAEIEQEMIPKLKITDIPESKRHTIYNGTNIHPPKLTPTERTRIIRTLYQIWILIHIDESILRPTFYTIRLRQLFYLNELLNWSRIKCFPTTNRWSTFSVYKDGRAALLNLYGDTYDCEPPVFQKIADANDEVGLFVVWDFYQDKLRNLICRKPVANLKWDEEPEPMKHLWDYENGDEGLVDEEW